MFIHSFIVYDDVTTIILFIIIIIISAYDDVPTISFIIIIVYNAYDDVPTISCSSFIHSFIHHSSARVRRRNDVTTIILCIIQHRHVATRRPRCFARGVATSPAASSSST